MRRPDIPVLTTLRFPAALAIVFYHFLPYTQCPFTLALVLVVLPSTWLTFNPAGQNGLKSLFF